MSWWNRKPKAEQSGSVLFRQSWAARPQDFATTLAARGVVLREPARETPDGWTAELAHPQWGAATLLCMRNPPLPPPSLYDFDQRLTDEEKTLARAARYSVGIAAPARTGNVLADRKDLLRFLRALMGDDGLVALDHASQASWSREGLDEELRHDAELDIDAIFTLHYVHDPEAANPDDRNRSFWLHSHGLAEIGFWDFDILDPSPDLAEHASELLRALAFAVVEGTLQADGPPWELVAGEPVRAVSARAFAAGAPAQMYSQWRESLDDVHLDGHAMLCDPAPGNWLSRLFRGTAPRASTFLRGPFPDEVAIRFSTPATELMAKRARQTLPLLRELVSELSEFEFPALVKLGFRVDGGGEDDREHLWFEVHGFEADSVDATLVNQPFRIERLKKDTRARQPLELLSDWTVLTPFGPLNPRQTRTLRAVRSQKEKLREMMAAYRAAGGQ